MRRLILFNLLILSACGKSSDSAPAVAPVSCAAPAVAIVRDVSFPLTDGTASTVKVEGAYCSDGCIEYTSVQAPKQSMRVCL